MNLGVRHGVPAGDAVALLGAGDALVEALAVLLEARRLPALAPGLVHHRVVLLRRREGLFKSRQEADMRRVGKGGEMEIGRVCQILFIFLKQLKELYKSQQRRLWPSGHGRVFSILRFFSS